MVTKEPNATITRRVDIARGLWIIDVTPHGWELADFEAGQYTTLELNGSVPSCARSQHEQSKRPDRFIRRRSMG